jgi:hypothetical protein
MRSPKKFKNSTKVQQHTIAERANAIHSLIDHTPAALLRVVSQITMMMVLVFE